MNSCVVHSWTKHCTAWIIIHTDKKVIQLLTRANCYISQDGIGHVGNDSGNRIAGSAHITRHPIHPTHSVIHLRHLLYNTVS